MIAALLFTAVRSVAIAVATARAPVPIRCRLLRRLQEAVLAAVRSTAAVPIISPYLGVVPWV
ncbi:hypothetical protein BX265_8368 [Streptomyces sp. TLI_235]|nr:hypothetical protein [Streptomyces sp. TLI_235]PBC66303.1 hypothetical protein BX265_8368 [Streptomyces sp. TLI_235]